MSKRSGKRERSGDGPDRHHERASWRRIEAMRERRQLREALADVWDEGSDVDDALFGDDIESWYYLDPDTSALDPVEDGDDEDDLDLDLDDDEEDVEGAD